MKTIVLATVVLMCMMGCNSTVDPGSVTNYPLSKNNSWSYDAAASLTNFRPAHAGITFRDTAISWITRVNAEGSDTLLDSIATWKFTTHDTGAVISDGVQHYIVSGDSLLLFAYYNPSLALPKRGLGYKYSFGRKQYNSVDELIKTLTAEISAVDTLWVELYPPPVLVFPLTIGKEWTYRTVPFRINKKIVGAENVSTPAGDFACYKIQWFWDINGDEKWDSSLTGIDFVNNKGLVKRTFEFKNLILSSSGSPDPLGYIDLKNEFTVKAFEGAIYPAIFEKRPR
jgi:hypothetical protein